MELEALRSRIELINYSINPLKIHIKWQRKKKRKVLKAHQ